MSDETIGNLNRDERIEHARAVGIRTQERYEDLINELANLRFEKVEQYGEGRYDMKDQLTVAQSKALLWANIQRKYQRATTELMGRPNMGVSRQDYLDGANYFLMVLEVGDEEGWL